MGILDFMKREKPAHQIGLRHCWACRTYYADIQMPCPFCTVQTNNGYKVELNNKLGLGWVMKNKDCKKLHTKSKGED